MQYSMIMAILLDQAHYLNVFWYKNMRPRERKTTWYHLQHMQQNRHLAQVNLYDIHDFYCNFCVIFLPISFRVVSVAAVKHYAVASAGIDNSMMTSSNGNIFRVTGPSCWEFTGPREFSTQRPVTQSFDVFFDLRLNKRLSKQPWGWWFETPSWSLWHQCNGIGKIFSSMSEQGLIQW